MVETKEQQFLLLQAQEILSMWPLAPVSVAMRDRDMVVATETGERLLKEYTQGVEQGFRCHMAMEYCIERGFYLIPRHILNKDGKPLTVYGNHCYALQDIWPAKPIQWQKNRDLYLLGEAMGEVHYAMMGFHQAYLEQPSVTWLQAAMDMAQLWLSGKSCIPSAYQGEWERLCFVMAKQIETLGRQESLLLQISAAMPFVHNGFCSGEIFILPQGKLWVGGWEHWSGGNSLMDLCAVLHKIAWQRNWDVKAMEAFLTGYRLKGICHTGIVEVICAWASLPFAAVERLRQDPHREEGAAFSGWQSIFALQKKKEKTYQSITHWAREYWGGGTVLCGSKERP